MGFTIDLLAESPEQIDTLGNGEFLCRQQLRQSIGAEINAIKHQFDV